MSNRLSVFACPPAQDDKPSGKRKRGAGDGWDSDDSDFEDLKGFERSGECCQLLRVLCE